MLQPFAFFLHFPKGHFYKGCYAWELQVGPYVFQLFHGQHDRPDLFKRGSLRVWKDSCWKMKGNRFRLHVNLAARNEYEGRY